MLALYSKTKALKLTRKVFDLFVEYRDSGIFSPDALIASFAFADNLDALVTVNRRHLKMPQTIRKIVAINKRFRLGRPLILLPRKLIELVS